jgi:hypothetical protein
MPFDKYNTPREANADLQHRLDIIEGRKIPSYELDQKEMKQSTQVHGEITYIQREKSARPNIK